MTFGLNGGGGGILHYSLNSHFTKIFFIFFLFTLGFYSGSCETPVRGNLTPSCQVQQSGSRSILVSPSTQPNHEPNSGRKSEHKKDPGSPASGRIHKETRETFRNLFLKKTKINFIWVWLPIIVFALKKMTEILRNMFFQFF